MTFDDYVKYRLLETAYGGLFWVLVFVVIGAVWVVQSIRTARRDHRNFERMRKSIMEGRDDDG